MDPSPAWPQERGFAGGPGLRRLLHGGGAASVNNGGGRWFPGSASDLRPEGSIPSASTCGPVGFHPGAAGSLRGAAYSIVHTAISRIQQIPYVIQ